jgi:hypothetical protein
MDAKLNVERAKNEWEVRILMEDVADDIINNNVNGAFEKLAHAGKIFKDIKDKDGLKAKIVEDYISGGGYESYGYDYNALSVITMTEDDKNEFNRLIREKLKENNTLNCKIQTKDEFKDFCVRDKIVFLTDNDVLEDISGYTGIIRDIYEDEKDNCIIEVEIEDGRIIAFSTKDYSLSNIDYAYALTTLKHHLFRISSKKVFIYDNGDTNYNEKYTQFTDVKRAESDIKIYTADYGKMLEKAQIEEDGQKVLPPHYNE